MQVEQPERGAERAERSDRGMVGAASSRSTNRQDSGAVPTATADELTARLHGSFPETGVQARITVEEVDDRRLRLRYRASADGAEIRPGGTVSGPTLMTVADCVAWLITLAQLPPGQRIIGRNAYGLL